MADKYSYNRLIEVMFELMSKKRIDSIRLSEITTLAKVSKSTFYRYFRDKYDLMNCCYDYVIGNMIKSELKYDNWLDVIEMQFQFFYENRNYLKNGFCTNKFDSLEQFIIKYSEQFYIKEVKIRTHSDTLDNKMLSAIHFNCAGSVAILRRWIESGTPTNYKDEARIHYDLMPDILRNLFPLKS